MKSVLLTAMFILVGKPLYCQTANTTVSAISDKEDKYLHQINEVYGPDYPSQDIRADLIVLLSKRISFLNSPAQGDKDHQLLTSLELRNKTNPLITPFIPGSFNTATFNPLRYNFNFFDSNYQSFRLDGTDYIMVVKPYIVGQ